MKRTISLAAGAALLLLGACATDTQSAAGQARSSDCFRISDIFTHRALDDQNILIRAGSLDYIVTVRDDALDLRSSDPLVLSSPDGRVCTGNGLGLSLLVGREPAHRLVVTQVARAPGEPAPVGS